MAFPAPKTETTPQAAFGRLLTILSTLRSECPWDRKQTMQSLRHLSIEELYELTDAILEDDLPEIKKELGDLMMHLVFYAKIAEEKDAFTITDVLNTVCDKLIHRHPHIYGDVKVENQEQVKQNWEQLKLKEGNKSVLSGVPKSLPALVKAFRIQEKVKGVGFDWENKEQVWEKVEEELLEFKQELTQEPSPAENLDRAEEEFGDLLFSLINYARFIGINPESALEKTNKKFIHRFNYLEEESKRNGKSIQDLSLEEMNAYWNQAKENL